MTEEEIFISNKHLVIYIEGAIMAAVAMALEYIPTSIGPSSIQVSLGIIPISIYSFRRGTKPGMSAALIWGILDLFLRGLGSGGFLNVWQGLLEYTIAFLVVGLAGVVKKQLNRTLNNKEHRKANYYVLLGIFIGTFSKYSFHFIAGVIFWGSFAPKGMNIWMYSLIINGGSFIASFIVSGFVCILIASTNKKLIMPN